MQNILVVRLGAMGDVIHCLPAASTLKRSFPKAKLHWVIKPRWAPLLEANPNVDEIIEFDRGLAGMKTLGTRLRHTDFDIAIDLQGLMQSAMIAKASGAPQIIGLDKSQAREVLASALYSEKVITTGTHRVDRYIDLVKAAGAEQVSHEFFLPEGEPEGKLPERFVLASPLAGWGAKQWPTEHWVRLAALLQSELELELVADGAPVDRDQLARIKGARLHLSSIPGLIHATRKAVAVIGVDSGPMHLAAALGKPGVAIFGPTDPASHGPFGGTLRVLRDAGAETSYKRDAEVAESMRAISPEQVMQALADRLAGERGHGA